MCSIIHITQSMSGFVDMVDGSSEADVATKALVLIVVGLQEHWKALIAYDLTKVLLSHALEEELHAEGIQVVRVTMADVMINTLLFVLVTEVTDSYSVGKRSNCNDHWTDQFEIH